MEKLNYKVSDKVSGAFATAVAKAKARLARAGKADAMKEFDAYLNSINEAYVEKGYVEHSAAWYLDVSDCVFESDQDPAWIEFSQMVLAEA